MKLRTCIVLAAAFSASLAAGADFQDLDVRAHVDAQHIVLGNDLVKRSWSRASFVTEELLDLRIGIGRVWSSRSPDFTLTLAGLDLPSSLFSVTEASVKTLPRRGLRVTIRLRPAADSLQIPGLPPGLEIIRVVECYPGVAGFRSETSVTAQVPLVVTSYTVEEIQPPAPVAPTLQSFRAGGDWREPDWPGPPLAIGDPHPDTWRVPQTKGSGEPLRGTAQWMSLAAANDERAFLVLERNDYASSQMSYDGGRARALVDLSRDVVYIGPFEEQGHLENPGPGPARQRVVVPRRPLRLEPVFLGFGTSADDEPWQHYKYLVGHRMAAYEKAIVFNTNGVDRNRISTGAKDDVDFDEFKNQLVVARALGVETFVFDDGWQARSGDWCPDSPQCPEPRWDGTPGSKFRPRFLDATFDAVRQELGDMRLGLWMSPMHFNPTSAAFQENPQWSCLPVSLGLVAVNLAQPDDSSQEAGIGTWNPEALGSDGETKLVAYIEGRIRTAIESWGVRYFKFDFMVWLDCLGVEPVDLYGYRESFIAMLDRLIEAHPEVTFEIDETNDYRLFPFESVARGPSWYQNGSPRPNEALHSSWVLSPYVPAFSLGKNALAGGSWTEFSIDYLMAVALPSHFTFFSPLTTPLGAPQPAEMPAAVITRVRRWTDYYKAHRDDLATFTYPLLEDPYPGDGWTALQPWNPETGRGFLLVYRQDSPDSVRNVALRNVPPNRTFALYMAPDDTAFGTRTSEELSAGVAITLPAKNSAAVIRIEPL